MFGITILNDKNGYGYAYRVRLGWSKGKPMMQESFLFSHFESQSDALKAAQVFRDLCVKTMEDTGIFPIDKRRDTPTIRSKSGVCGVSRTHQRSGGVAMDNVYIWQAAWVNDDGSKGYACFAEKRYGAEEAYQLACASRMIRRNIRHLEAREFDYLFDNGQNILAALDSA